MSTFNKVIDFLLDQGYGLYLIVIITVYGHTPYTASFWAIYIPTMIMVWIAKGKARFEGDKENRLKK